MPATPPQEDSSMGFVKQTVGSIMGVVILGSAVFAEDFTVRLSLKNAHLREVFFGYSARATAGYDRKLDDFAPPPGIQTGYVGFVPGVKNLPLFYKDIRGPEPDQKWEFYTKVFTGKPMTISWKRDALPKGWSLSLKAKDKTMDMTKVESITLQESQTLTIKAKKQAARKKTENGR